MANQTMMFMVDTDAELVISLCSPKIIKTLVFVSFHFSLPFLHLSLLLPFFPHTFISFPVFIFFAIDFSSLGNRQLKCKHFHGKRSYLLRM